MKRIVLVAALATSMYANAQLTVYESGQVRVGHHPKLESPTSEATLDVCDWIYNPKTAISIPQQGSISFGSVSGAAIRGNGSSGTLNFFANRAISFEIGSATALLRFRSLGLSSTVSISAPSFLTSSDVRLKREIGSLEDSFIRLEDINAVSYRLSAPSASDPAVKDSAQTMAITADSAEATTDDRTHFGFIAQEIREVFPNLVVEDEEGFLSVDYTGFIPLLVEAYKDLAGKVKEQEETIAMLTRSPRYAPASVSGAEELKLLLKQNSPNPFNVSTSIEAYVPETVSKAFICVYDLQGTQVRRIDLDERGAVTAVIDASSLRPGMYVYSLIADGAEADSKRMIITD